MDHMSKPRILVVDDDKKIARLLAVILDRVGGFDVYEENHSTMAVTIAKGFRPDIAVLDVNMPGMDGGEIASAFRRDPALCQTSILFVTSIISKNEEGAHNGMYYLPKPVEPFKFIRIVREILDARAAMSCAA